jgi:hypothetical protein
MMGSTHKEQKHMVSSSKALHPLSISPISAPGSAARADKQKDEYATEAAALHYYLLKLQLPCD